GAQGGVPTAPGGGVSSAQAVHDPALRIDVLDGDSGNVLVVPDAPAQLVAPNQQAGYTLELTRPPTAPVTISLLTIAGLTLSSADPRFQPAGGLGGGAPAGVVDPNDRNPPVRGM